MYDAAQQELKDLFKTTEYLASARFIERSDALYDKLRGTGEWYSPGARVAYRACLEQTLTITARVPEASDQHAVCADAVPRSRSCRLRRRCSSFLLAAALDARAFLVAAVCADDVLPRSSLALSHADAVLVLRSRCLTALFVLARGLFERSSFSLAACSSALALARGLLERSSLSLAACSSALRSRSRPARALFVLATLPLSHFVDLPVRFDGLLCSPRWVASALYRVRRAAVGALYRVRRAAVDAHGSYATFPSLPQWPIHRMWPSLARSSTRSILTRQHGTDSLLGLTARTPCSCAEAPVCSLECSFTACHSHSVKDLLTFRPRLCRCHLPWALAALLRPYRPYLIVSCAPVTLVAK